MISSLTRTEKGSFYPTEQKRVYQIASSISTDSINFLAGSFFFPGSSHHCVWQRSHQDGICQSEKSVRIVSRYEENSTPARGNYVSAGFGCNRKASTLARGNCVSPGFECYARVQALGVAKRRIYTSKGKLHESRL